MCEDRARLHFVQKSPYLSVVHIYVFTDEGLVHTYLLTYCMVQSPSWAANRFAASPEIPRISRNPKVHYRTHKRPPSVFILGQPNPFHIPTSHLLEIHPNIIHPSTPRSLQWSLSLWFPHQEPIHPLSSPISATCPAHLILLDFITRTTLGEQYRSYTYFITEYCIKCAVYSDPVSVQALCSRQWDSQGHWDIAQERRVL